MHVLICGRQGIDYRADEAPGEPKALGYRMRAEGETAYEADVLLQSSYGETLKGPLRHLVTASTRDPDHTKSIPYALHSATPDQTTL